MVLSQDGSAYRARVKDYYSSRASRYDQEVSRHWQADDPFRSAMTSFLADGLADVDRPGGIVLDIGAGSGRTTLSVPLQAATLVALDLSQPMLARLASSARASGAKVPALIVGDAHRLPLPDASVDAAVLVSVLPYVDLDVAGRELSRVLKRGAVALTGSMCSHPADAENWRDHAFQTGIVPPYLARFRRPADIEHAWRPWGLRSTGSKTVRFRRTFSDLKSDRQGNTESGTLRAGLEVWHRAPEAVASLYEVNTAGFTQFYALQHWCRAANAAP